MAEHLAWGCLSKTPLKALLIEEEGQLIGLVLAGEKTLKKAGIPFWKQLYFFETGDRLVDVVTVEYNQPLCHPSHAQKVRTALRHWIETEGRKTYDEIVLNRILLEHQDDLTPRQGVEISVFRQDTAYAIDLQEVRDMGGVLETLSSNTRYQIKRSMKKYEQRGTLKVEAAQTRDQAFQWFAEMGVLHQAYWIGKGDVGSFGYKNFLEIHEALLKTTPVNETVEVLKVSAGDHVIGYLYNFLYNKRVYYYLAGFAYEEDSHLKPGLVCHVMAGGYHAARGMNLYDFMGGAYQYKTNLGDPLDPMVGVCLQYRTLKWHVFQGIKKLVKSLKGVKRSSS
jgi:CelD/BcsL family acetyltransferase involved in cellulose biosynthesis